MANVTKKEEKFSFLCKKNERHKKTVLMYDIHSVATYPLHKKHKKDKINNTNKLFLKNNSLSSQKT